MIRVHVLHGGGSRAKVAVDCQTLEEAREVALAPLGLTDQSQMMLYSVPSLIYGERPKHSYQATRRDRRATEWNVFLHEFDGTAPPACYTGFDRVEMT